MTNSTKRIILGSGDSKTNNQKFKLPKLPSKNAKIKIYVNNSQWTRVSSLSNRKSDEKIYVISQDGNGNTWIQFGDGKNGRRLPSGSENVASSYRIKRSKTGKMKSSMLKIARVLRIKKT
jgi:hypothetical protein